MLEPGNQAAVNETGRVEAFSDGVFAIALTLLVLDIHVPLALPEGASLLEALLRQWPTFVAFVTSFATIGIMWINHHRLFNLIQRSDHILLLCNTLLLFGITFLPFPTALLAQYIGRPDEHTAALVYTATCLAIAIFFNLLWRCASSRNLLLDRATDPQLVRTINRSYAFAPLLYLAAFLLAFVNVVASVAITLGLALYFALPPPGPGG